MPDSPPPGRVHTLTVDFGRELSPAEWYAVITKVRRIPHVQTIRVNQVNWDQCTAEGRWCAGSVESPPHD